MPIATIIRDQKGCVYIRISSEKPATGGNVEVIDVMLGGDIDELRDRARNFAKEQEGYSPVTRKIK